MGYLERGKASIDQKYIRENEVKEGPFYGDTEIISQGAEISQLFRELDLYKIMEIKDKISKKGSTLKRILTSNTFKEYVSPEEYKSYVTIFNTTIDSYNTINQQEDNSEKLPKLESINIQLTKLLLDLKKKLIEINNIIEGIKQNLWSQSNIPSNKSDITIEQSSTSVSNDSNVEETQKSENIQPSNIDKNQQEKENLIVEILHALISLGEFSAIEDLAQRVTLINETREKLEKKSIEMLKVLLSGYQAQILKEKSEGKQK